MEDGEVLAEPRHGIKERPPSMLAASMQLYYVDKLATLEKEEQRPAEPVEWRQRVKQRTSRGYLVLCLNLGVDPPDVYKTSPCAKLECWLDPTTMKPTKAIESIGRSLLRQYQEFISRRDENFKTLLDPYIEDFKRLTVSVRKSSKDERLLFHYNGHGVPKPTASGEIWVFNKQYTQYIPVSLLELQSWIGSPVVYVWDCSSAGNIVNTFIKLANQARQEANTNERNLHHHSFPANFNEENFQLAACGPGESLPMDPKLPADVFSACLSNPVPMAMWWFCIQNERFLGKQVDRTLMPQFPGTLGDRRSPRGEMNWIFTTVTDTIAWSILHKNPERFKRLFRQDLVVASLFRNFFLAERILSTYKLHPMSIPELPSTRDHPMWKAWDLAVDRAASQAPKLMEYFENHHLKDVDGGKDIVWTGVYESSTFFADQLTAFDVWLRTAKDLDEIPMQLPVILQVLLSQVHRLRALMLLSRFMDLGPKAVHAALMVGIFPYVLRLLQSPAAELRPVLAFIWARILAVDDSVRSDLIKDNAYAYFITILTPGTPINAIPHISEHRATCAFNLSTLCHNFPPGQQGCFEARVISYCLAHASDPSPLLRQWVCLCLGELWNDFPQARDSTIDSQAHERLYPLLDDDVADVRAAAVYALGLLLQADDNPPEHIANVQLNLCIMLLKMSSDGSPTVRQELVCALSICVTSQSQSFAMAAYEVAQEDGIWTPAEDRVPATTSQTASQVADYVWIWKTLLILSVDPDEEVRKLARNVVDHVNYTTLMTTTYGELATNLLHLKPPKASSRPVTPPNGVPLMEPSEDTLNGHASHQNVLLDGTSSNASLGTSENGNIETDSIKSDVDDFIPLPLKSTLWERKSQFFRQPQMKTEAEEPGSETFNAKIYRRKRNAELISAAQERAQLVYDRQLAWEGTTAAMPHDGQVEHIVFHAFDPHVLWTDQYNRVTVYDWDEATAINRFPLRIPQDFSIISLQLINENDFGILLVATDDFLIRLYQQYQDENVNMISSWRGLTYLEKSSRQAGLKCEWQQGPGHLIVGGDNRQISIWDASRETCAYTFPTMLRTCVTSLTSDKGNIFFAGFGNGIIKKFDKRLPPNNSIVTTFEEHSGWIVDVRMQAGGRRELLSASDDGKVKYWDQRFPKTVSTLDIAQPSELTAFALHDNLPFFATGSIHHSVKLFDLNTGNVVTSNKAPGGIFGQRSADINSIAFHPYNMQMIYAGADSSITFANSHDKPVDLSAI